MFEQMTKETTINIWPVQYVRRSTWVKLENQLNT